MKITDIEINENNVKSVPDTLTADNEKSARDIKNVFDKLPELIARKHNSLVEYVNSELCTKSELKTTVKQEVMGIGAEEIARMIYDSDKDGMVDNAKQLDGRNAEYFAEKTAVETAQATADNHILDNSNPHGVTASQVGLGNVTNDKQMPIAGGTFTGNAVAYSSNRNTNGGCLRNIEVRTSSATGTLQSTNKIVMVRK